MGKGLSRKESHWQNSGNRNSRACTEVEELSREVEKWSEMVKKMARGGEF